jgi:hypothetical protein
VVGADDGSATGLAVGAMVKPVRFPAVGEDVDPVMLPVGEIVCPSIAILVGVAVFPSILTVGEAVKPSMNAPPPHPPPIEPFWVGASVLSGGPGTGVPLGTDSPNCFLS